MKKGFLLFVYFALQFFVTDLIFPQNNIIA